MADEIVPAEYQGVWAAARDCTDNLQNVISDSVNRRLAVCRVMQVVSWGEPEAHSSTVSLNCGGLQSREIWRDESVEGADYLVIVQLEHGAAVGRPSIDLYKRCPGIPLGEIPLSEIPGNPVVNAAAEEKWRRQRPPLKSCARGHFRIRAQRACGSTDPARRISRIKRLLRVAGPSPVPSAQHGRSGKGVLQPPVTG